MSKIKFLIVVFLLIVQVHCFSQGVGINSDGAEADISAMLDIKSANKGLLIPQVALTGENDVTTIPTPATSLLIYNTTAGFGLTPGYYYNAGTSGAPVWTRLATGSLSGSGTATRLAFWNSATDLSSNSNLYWDNTNFRLGIGTELPTYTLTLGNSGNVFGVENASIFLAKNSVGGYEQYFWPRWSDNVMYMNYGFGGFNIRNNSFSSAMFFTNDKRIGIGTTTPNSSAILDVNSTNKGVIIPQIALTGINDATTIATPAVSLLIYNTATVSDVTPGYYYNSGTTVVPVWTRFATTIADGSETKVNAGTNITVTGAGTTASPYVVNATTHYIGESYGGGIVFYVYDNGQHGLIAATTDQSTGIQWFNGTGRYTGAFGDGLYSGEMNTSMIVSTQMADNQTGNFAAKVCADYSVYVSGVNYGDWYLPSMYELDLLYAQKAVVGGFALAFYWSSKEINDTGAMMRNFATGTFGTSGKNNLAYVRAIRAF